MINSFFVGQKFTLSNFSVIFQDNSTYSAFLNTVKLIGITLLGTWLVGISLALIRQKTDFKYKKAIDGMVFLSFTIPSYILSISWIQLMSRGGYVERLLKVINPSYRYTFNAYSIGAVALVMILHLYPFVYYGMLNALKMIRVDVEQSGLICGSKAGEVFRKITLPLLLPTVISTGLLVMSRTMANFGVTAQLALPVGKEVLTTKIYSHLSALNLGDVAALSVILITFTTGLFYLSERLVKRDKYNNGCGIEQMEGVRYTLGSKSKYLKVLVGVFFTLTVLLPYASIVISSFLKRWGLPITGAHMTLHNYKLLFGKAGMIYKPLFNSASYGLMAAGIALLVASMVLYLDVFYRNRLTGILMHMAQVPIAFPNIILGVGAIFAWINLPFKFYGSSWIIIMTYSILFLPIVIKQMQGGALMVDLSLEASARTMAIPIWRRYSLLFMPQIKNSILSGVLICFLISLREIPISLLLYTEGTETLGVMLFMIQSNAYGLEMTSAVAVVVVVMSVFGNLIVRKIGGKNNGSYQ